ncbi:MAG: type III pantothenate kinase [Bacteroidales bacterium]|nr:type III pantothenate kinase [Bacteroidales bacterium]
MNLAIDCGNTSMKVGLFENEAIFKTFVFPKTDDEAVVSLLSEYTIERAILSSVSGVSPLLANAFQKKVPCFVLLSAQTPLPIKNLYRTPETLGPDRIAAAVAADMLSPVGAPSLVIDAGTAVTYEFVSADSEYMGGNIAPGLSMRFKALNHFTKKLPLVSCRENFEPVGRDTENAILAGVVEGMLFEMEGYIEKYTQQNPNLCVFLTGGDAFFFEKRLKNRIFANENLLLIGLNRILNYNV